MNSFRPIPVFAMIAGLLVLTFALPSFAQMGHGMHHNMWGGSVERGNEWNYCPYCGGGLQYRDGYEQGHRGGLSQDRGDGKPS